MAEAATVDCCVVCDSAAGVLQCRLVLPVGSTLQTALDSARLQWPQAAIDWAGAVTGIWGQRCARSVPLKHGDRIEVYRALPHDPKLARRSRARAAARRS